MRQFQQEPCFIASLIHSLKRLRCLFCISFIAKRFSPQKCDLWHSLRFRGWSQDVCGAHFGKDKAVYEISVNRSVSNKRNPAHMCYRLSHAKKLEIRAAIAASSGRKFIPESSAIWDRFGSSTKPLRMPLAARDYSYKFSA